MARTPAKDYHPLGLDDWLGDGPRYYGDEAMRRVMRAVSRHLSYEWSDEGPSNAGEYVRLYLVLQADLNMNAALFRHNSNREERPTPSALMKDFEKIEAAASRLLAALHTPNGELDELPPLLRWDGGLESRAVEAARGDAAAERFTPFPASVRGATALRDALMGVRRIREWAKEAEEQAREAKDHDREKKADNQHETFLEGLAPEDRFIHNLMGTWREVFGRFDVGSSDFRNFAYEALVVVSEDVTDDGIRGRVERLQQRIREYDAIYARMFPIEPD